MSLHGSPDYCDFLKLVRRASSGNGIRLDADNENRLRFMYGGSDKYYEACSIVWMFLEQSNLVNEISTQYSNQEVLNAFVGLLSSSRRPATLQIEGIKSIFGNFDSDAIAEFKGFVGVKYGDDDVANKLASVLGMPLSLKDLESSIDTIYDQVCRVGCSRNPCVGWLLDIDNCVGKLAMILTKIRWHLLAIFGSNSESWRRLGCTEYSCHDGDFLKLIEFYRDGHPLGYEGLSSIDFEHLGDLVRNALDGWLQSGKKIG